MSQQPELPIDLKKLKPFFIGGAILLFLLIFGRSTFIILQPTERGILFKKYTSGLDVEHVYGEGLNIVAPWNDMIIYDVSEQKLDEKMDVLSSNGLSIDIDVSVRFNPMSSEIGHLYQSFKLDYQERLVRQELRSAVRRIVGRYTPEELYSTKREEIETTINEETNKVLAQNHVILKALLIRSITLPTKIKSAIERKLEQEQQSLEYKYKLEKAQKEAEKVKIEAQGKADANRILNASLTPNILKEKGIEATLKLSNSPNAKVIVVGNSEGLPLILGNN